VVVDSGGVEVVRNSVNEDKLGPESSVLYLFQEGVVESGYVSTRLVLNGGLAAVSIPRLVAKHYV